MRALSAVICLSTDKAAYPINSMGMTKAIEEKVAIAKSRHVAAKQTICCTRYGNVMCSRGSVIPLWIDQIKIRGSHHGYRAEHDKIHHGLWRRR